MKLNRKILRVVAVMCALVVTLSLAACGDKPSSKPSSDDIISQSSSLPSSSSTTEIPSSSSDSDSSSSDSSSSSSDPNVIPKDTRTPAQVQADLLTKMVVHHQKNQETVGWLYMPGTTIDEAVVQHPKDVNGPASSHYYLRRNSLGAQDFYGSYYADARGIIYNRDTLPSNSVVYGHNVDLNDDPNSIKFGQLNKLLDKTFAQENQFIYMSTPESEMVWQIFAVFDTTIDFVYNNPNPDPAEFLNVISGARSRSKFNYDVKVGPSDNILTLSTCTYRYDKKNPNRYRYVVMAKLLEKGAALTPAKVEANPTIAKP